MLSVLEMEETLQRERLQADTWRRELIFLRERLGMPTDDLKRPLGGPTFGGMRSASSSPIGSNAALAITVRISLAT